MSRVRLLALVVLLLSYGAVGARQPAVRTSVPLGVKAEALAAALEIRSPDRSRLLLDVVRVAFASPDGQEARESLLKSRMRAVFLAPTPDVRETVPLPLDPAVWREAILGRPVADNQLIAAILSERSSALLYHGLAALDDETLAALGPDREALSALRQHAGTFATFGRAVKIRAGHVVVPGGTNAEPLWQELVGVEPARPGAFVRRLFSSESGRLAFFFDTLTQLDQPHRLFAIGRTLPETARLERLRALLDVFEQVAPEWRPDERPFMRPAFDPSTTLSLVGVQPDGSLAPPAQRGFWAHVFRGDDGPDPPFGGPAAGGAAVEEDPTAVDAAWIVSRVHRAPAPTGQRRLEAILFGQRTLSGADDLEDAGTATRGFVACPALVLTLERMHIATPSRMARAGVRAQALNEIKDDITRRLATIQLQATLGVLDRATQRGGLTSEEAAGAVDSLLAIDVGLDGYGPRLAPWLRESLTAIRSVPVDTPDPFEDILIGIMAGPAPQPDAELPVIAWEGQRYRVDVTFDEARRLKAIRQKQGGTSLDSALALFDTARPQPGRPPAQTTGRDGRGEAARSLAESLTSILYAAYLGQADGMAVTGGNVALRHDLGIVPGKSMAWRLPIEEYRPHGGWRVTGSLLGLDTALAGLSLRRLDTSAMPEESRLSQTLRQTAALTAVLLQPHDLTDAARDEIAAALGRGRARVAGLSPNREDVERIARDAGLSEWRREALLWTMTHDPGRASAAFSLVELFWIGSPRSSAAAPLDLWGSASLPLTGCLCLQMPRAQPWENLAGRPALGLQATRAADVNLLAADALAVRKLPAALAPGIVALAMQDALDTARPSYFDDWTGFTSAVTALPSGRMDDYVASLAAGPLVPLPRSSSTRR